jgi:hypothetical protein
MGSETHVVDSGTPTHGHPRWIQRHEGVDSGTGAVDHIAQVKQQVKFFFDVSIPKPG